MSTDRNTAGAEPSAERSNEKIALVRELIEALTTVGNYLAVANRIVRGEPRSPQDSIVEALEKSVRQFERASEAVRRLHTLLLSESRTGDDS
jgi:pilus assembly protein TadC